MWKSRGRLPVRRGEIGGCLLVEGAVRANVVVVEAPGFDRLARVVERRKPVRVETLEPELPVEALDEGILIRLTWLDETQCDAVLLGPGQERSAREFRPVIRDDGFRKRMSLGELVERPHDSRLADRGVDDRRGPLARVVVRDREDAKAPARSELIRDEVDRPALVGADGGQKRLRALPEPLSWALARQASPSER